MVVVDNDVRWQTPFQGGDELEKCLARESGSEQLEHKTYQIMQFLVGVSLPCGQRRQQNESRGDEKGVNFHCDIPV
jgi:hypothetical protein